jgi:hypothetical protein
VLSRRVRNDQKQDPAKMKETVKAIDEARLSLRHAGYDVPVPAPPPEEQQRQQIAQAVKKEQWAQARVQIQKSVKQVEIADKASRLRKLPVGDVERVQLWRDVSLAVSDTQMVDGKQIRVRKADRIFPRVTRGGSEARHRCPRRYRATRR